MYDDEEIPWSNLSLSHKLGEGGFGEVWAGKWMRIGRQGEAVVTDVAVKKLKIPSGKISEKFLEDFRREIGMLR
jgi:hypothetical protein